MLLTFWCNVHKDARQQRKRNKEDLELQAKARKWKEELEKEKNLDNAAEQYVEFLELIQM